MYTIVMDDHKNLVQTVRTKLCQHDKLADRIQFLVPNAYDEIDLTTFTVVLKYVDQGNVPHSEMLLSDGAADIDDYTRYIMPVTTELTRFEGDIEIRLTLTKNDYEAGSQYVLNSKTTILHIYPVFENFNIDVNGTKTYFMTYEDILDALEANRLSAHDVIFTTDTYECYVLDNDLVPRKITARTALYDSVEEAVRALNNSSSTYEGQIVAIKSGDSYLGYMVNLDDDRWTVVSLGTPDDIDYNSLLNKPITNLIGTQASPINISELADGTYCIAGSYVLTDGGEILSAAFGNVWYVSHGDEDVTAKQVTSDSIIDYVIEENSVTIREYALKDWVEGHCAAIQEEIELKQDKLTAGNGIQITDDGLITSDPYEPMTNTYIESLLS